MNILKNGGGDQEVAVLGIDSYDFLPQLSCPVNRVTLGYRMLPNNQKAKITILGTEDADACYELLRVEYEEEKKNGKRYLIQRDKDEVESMMDFSPQKNSGGLVLGLTVGDDRLAAIGAIHLIENESQMGRGYPYYGAQCQAHQQIYFKMVMTHPEIQHSDIKAAKILYPYRLAVALFFEDRECFVVKSTNVSTKAFYDREWTCVNRHYLPATEQENLNLTEEELYLNTYAITRQQALSKLEQNYEDIFHGLQKLKHIQGKIPYQHNMV